MGSRNQESGMLPTASRRLIATAALFALSACGMLAQDFKLNYTAVNVADSTQGFGNFANFPAINNRGAAAFVATHNSDGKGVFKWEDGAIRTIASRSSLSSFGDDVVINASSVVGYDASLTDTVSDRAIFTSNGSWTRLIVDEVWQRLAGKWATSVSGVWLRSVVKAVSDFVVGNARFWAISDTLCGLARTNQ